ncbi:MAG: hypothetical protein NTZ49_01050 [Candidatus Parcubacteria bacterium]|nr:hypothetical protein [Candidatus Parcubacteria bacterium]
MPNSENQKSKETKSQTVNAPQIDKAQLISRLNEIYPQFNVSRYIDKNGNLIKHERNDRDKLIAKLADNFGENKLNDAELLSVVGHTANLIRLEGSEPELNKSIDAAETLFKEMGGKMFPKINPNDINFDAVVNFTKFSEMDMGKSRGFLVLMDSSELSEMDNLRRNGNNELLLDKLRSLTQSISNHAFTKFEGVNLREEGEKGWEESAESKNEYKKIMPQMMEHLYKISLFCDKIEKQIKLDKEQKKIENVRQKIENSGKQGSRYSAGTWKYEPAPNDKEKQAEKPKHSEPEKAAGMTKEEIEKKRKELDALWKRSQETQRTKGTVSGKEQQAKKPKPEEDPELGKPALRDKDYKDYNLGKDGPFKALYTEHKTPAEVKSAVTPEMKRLFLEKMLKDIDGGIYGAEEFVLKNPGSVLNRKGVAHFSGIGVTVGYNAIVYQKIAIAAEGRVISPNEIAVMPMVDYLKRYLGYDLRADKKRAELLKKFTNALS